MYIIPNVILFLLLYGSIWLKKISQEVTFRNIYETKNHFIEETNENNGMSKKHKKVWLLLTSAVTRLVSISAFASIVGILIGYTSSAVGLKICAIIAGIKNYKSIIKKMRKEHDQIVLLAKTELNRIEVLISKALIDSYISHDEFV